MGFPIRTVASGPWRNFSFGLYYQYKAEKKYNMDLTWGEHWCIMSLCTQSISFTVFFVWKLRAHDGASAEHHLVLGERACLVWEDVIDLSKVLCDVQSSTLHAAVRLLIIQVDVINDEEDLTNFHQFNRQVEGDGYQDLWGRISSVKKMKGNPETKGKKNGFDDSKVSNKLFLNIDNVTCRRMIMVKNMWKLARLLLLLSGSRYGGQPVRDSSHM